MNTMSDETQPRPDDEVVEEKEVLEEEPVVEPEEEDNEPPRAPTPEEIRDNATEILNHGKAVLAGPVWETARLYGRGIRDGINALFEGVTGKKRND